MLLHQIKKWFQIWFGGMFSSQRFYKSLNGSLKRRQKVESNVIKICIHEWGGYSGKRKKNVKNIREFECGLDYQLLRFNNQTLRDDWRSEITLTVSEINKLENLSLLHQQCNHIYSVSNIGMDFSGYSFYVAKILNEANAYVILTNTSVNKIQTNFLQSYIDYMENNLDIGILGVSASSKYYHTLARWNYNPHLQSFFLLTTTEVLRDMITLNNGRFPGINEVNKHLLIRNGEVKLSQLVSRAGYKLAVVLENKVVKFSYESFNLPNGDLRTLQQNPNTIYPIKQI